MLTYKTELLKDTPKFRYMYVTEMKFNDTIG